MRRLVAALALAAVLGGPAAAAGASCPRASFPDVEDEVMCLVCGVPLSLADAPQAERERAFIRQEIAHCRDKRQIEAALVAQYGPRVLAKPPASGFDLTAYVVPVLALLAGVVVIAAGVLRWRRRAAPQQLAPARAASAEDQALVAAELARFEP